MVLNLRVDSYPLETNVHYPTDYNLLWDAERKCIDYVDKIVDGTSIAGWRKSKYLLRKIKSGYRQLTSQTLFIFNPFRVAAVDFPLSIHISTPPGLHI